MVNASISESLILTQMLPQCYLHPILTTDRVIERSCGLQNRVQSFRPSRKRPPQPWPSSCEACALAQYFSSTLIVPGSPQTILTRIYGVQFVKVPEVILKQS